ncbi:ribosome maturation factor RimM [Desulfobaculum xiamenense]|nr:ribosome maturation factor RimM [Desulfobaculum xiamenense]
MQAGSGNLVLVGEVTKPHGLRGEVCVRLYADSPSFFDLVDVVHLRPAAEAPAPDPVPAGRGRRPARPQPPRMRRVRIVSWREHKGMVLLVFEGAQDRSAAEALRGSEILVRETELPDLSDDEVYIHQIEGLAVRLEGGEPLGVVREVLTPAGQEIWAIETPDGREVLFPVAEQFVLAVDLEAGFVEIAPPPGLLDLYLSDDA